MGRVCGWGAGALKNKCQGFFCSFWTRGPAVMIRIFIPLDKDVFSPLLSQPQPPSEQQILLAFPVNKGKLRASSLIPRLYFLTSAGSHCLLSSFPPWGFLFYSCSQRAQGRAGCRWFSLPRTSRCLPDLPHHRDFRACTPPQSCGFINNLVSPRPPTGCCSVKRFLWSRRRPNCALGVT